MSTYVKKGDVVLVPQKNSKPLEGKVKEIIKKQYTDYAIVEVEYTDMTGTKHTTTLRPIKAYNLIKQSA